MTTVTMNLRAALFSLAAFLTFVPGLSAAARSGDWKAVDAAVAQGLPKTAVERLEPILEAALAEKAYPEAVRALAYKINLESGVQEGPSGERIPRLQSEIQKAPLPMRPALEAILAHWYWQYFENNRWKILRRTQTEAPGADFRTWDLATLLAEIDRHFSAALDDPALLKATPIADYDPLLVRGSAPDAYRPTAFDFLAHEALQFYQAARLPTVVSEDAFALEADSPIFDEPGEFLRWQPGEGEPAAPLRRAIALYQELLRFHQNDADRSAFLDADRERLAFGFNSAVGEDKTDRYQAALRRVAEAAKSHPLSARAWASLARQANQEGDPARAREFAQHGLRAFPRSVGGAECYNLIQEIEAPSARLETEAVWNAPWPSIDVTYRNVSHVYFRAVRMNFPEYLQRARWSFGQIDDALRAQLSNQAPELTWDAALPPTPDCKERVEKLPAPGSLRPGFYAVLASFDPKFERPDYQLNATTVWVSDLALVVRHAVGSAPATGFVLNAITGEPVAGAVVRRWKSGQNGVFSQEAPLATDANGLFRLDQGRESVVLLAEHGGQAVSSLQQVYVGDSISNGGRRGARNRTVFFTDRALYRPGQTIQYKGLCVRADEEHADYRSVARRKLTVTFKDPNGKEIARAEHETNDYGSFSGVFTAPRDRLLGRMSLVVEHGPSGSVSFNVEEYKRPKFEVVLQPPTEAARLSEIVSLHGKATAYTGAAIGDAKVVWRVERRVRLPRWCWWWEPPSVKAIAHGTARTAPDGSFTLQFTAAPDRAVPEKTEPKFDFTTYVDVTDATGETRSAGRSITAGYTALEASLTTESWLTAETPVKLTVTTTSVDGDPQPARGIIRIHTLKQPPKPERAALSGRAWWGRSSTPETDPTDPRSWEDGAEQAREGFVTDQSGETQVSAQLAPGIYRAALETEDRFGRRVTALTIFQVIAPDARTYPIRVPQHVAARSWSAEPGETFTALWATGYNTGRAFVEFEADGRTLRSYWTDADRTQTLIQQPVGEALRGGFTLRITYVRENRAYLTQRLVQVPWTNKQLTVKWESFRSKLQPGQRETWTAVVSGPNATRAAAEMVATLYDASLDQFQPHSWSALNVFRSESPRGSSEFQNVLRGFGILQSWRPPALRNVLWSYRSFPSALLEDTAERIVLSPFSVARGNAAGSPAFRNRKQAGENSAIQAMPAMVEADAMEIGAIADDHPIEFPPAPKPELDAVKARKNLNETAFFLPHLQSGDDGTVRISFTVPEALTRWKFLAFAHDRDLRQGLLTDTAVTSKDLMVEPNPPRFLREGDVVEFAVKISNQSDQSHAGTAGLTFADTASLKPVNAELGLRATEQSFEIPAHQSRTCSWRISVPDGLGFLTYKAVASTGALSDGEEGCLPVLSRRILVTESLPLPIRGEGTRTFNFEKLLNSGSSTTLQNQSLTVQMTSQPAWYAVLALPYLMEYPYECSEQLFNRLYANALAGRIAGSDPKIRRVFDLWKASPALESPLEKNGDLKSVALEETPWLRQAQNESEARRNVGLLFDHNRLEDEQARALQKLSERQLADGLWSWFPGGRPSEYISLYILTGFGRLRHLGVEIDPAPAVRALSALDHWIAERHRSILAQPDPAAQVPGPLESLYLYGRSFFLKDWELSDEARAAVDYFLGQARSHWLQAGSRQTQGQLALALERFGDPTTAQAIAQSLKERSVSSEELGRFWPEPSGSWWWYHAPIETQALMIEVFDEVAHDAQAVEDCKVWLLKQKQTQHWRTTKATADAIYGLLRRGDDLLARDATVEVVLGDRPIQPDRVKAGTGFFEQRIPGSAVVPAMGRVTVKKTDGGVSWGSVHWQYLEDVAKISPHEGTPLTLRKTLYVRETTAKGPVLKPLAGPVAVGDELVVRIELRTDRDMEYLHLKDQRGSGTEPVNVLSGYRHQDGLGYYESTRDTASHFFIDYLPRGTYVFEYSTRVQLRGRYQSGIAEIQCMYAPEFNSHSESTLIEVK